MEKLIKIKMLKKCMVAGKRVVAGDIVEVPEEDKKVLVGMHLATEDLKAVVPAPPKKEKPAAENK